MNEKELIEDLSNLVHEQWKDWSKTICTTEHISESKLKRWKELWIDYENLFEIEKETDRFYAKKIVAMLKEKKII